MKTSNSQVTSLINEVSYATQKAQSFSVPVTLSNEFDNSAPAATNSNYSNARNQAIQRGSSFRPSINQNLPNECELGKDENSQNLLQRRLQHN